MKALSVGSALGSSVIQDMFSLASSFYPSSSWTSYIREREKKFSGDFMNEQEGRAVNPVRQQSFFLLSFFFLSLSSFALLQTELSCTWSEA